LAHVVRTTDCPIPNAVRVIVAWRSQGAIGAHPSGATAVSQNAIGSVLAGLARDTKLACLFWAAEEITVTVRVSDAGIAEQAVATDTSGPAERGRFGATVNARIAVAGRVTTTIAVALQPSRVAVQVVFARVAGVTILALTIRTADRSRCAAIEDIAARVT